jgi:hypothetical protein
LDPDAGISTTVEGEDPLPAYKVWCYERSKIKMDPLLWSCGIYGYGVKVVLSSSDDQRLVWLANILNVYIRKGEQ